MRIGMVAPLWESVPPQLYGGTERVVAYLTDELVRMGHEVTLFASGDSRTTARLVPICPRALRLDPQTVDGIALHVLMVERVFRQADEFDILHFHIDYLHFPLARRSHVPHVSTLHGRLDIPELGPLFREYREMPVISISHAQRTPLPWLNWQTTVYHGIPQDHYRPYPEPGQYLAFLGRISPEKGVHEAIRIAIRCGVPLKIAAKIDQVDRTYYEAMVRPLLKHPLVEYIGEIGEHEKNEFLGQALALLFPIDWPEPFGLVMIEAMACGTPVVAYRRGSVPEVLEDGVTGFIVDGIEAAVQAVGRAAELDRRRIRTVFERRFTSERMARDYLRAYQQTIERTGRRAPRAA